MSPPRELDAGGGLAKMAMMRAEDLKERLRKQPFQPFRFFLTDGAQYDIRHPDLVIVGRTEIVVGLAGNGDLPERFASIDPLHVVRIEPVPTKPAA